MIELTEQQIQELGKPGDTPRRVVNPQTNETFVLVPVGEYQRLTEEYDDSPWTREELEGLAWEAGEMADRADLTAEESLKRVRAFGERKVAFVTAVRSGKKPSDVT
jgi:hypothetical protein